LRPALVLADAGRNDWLLCQITSQPFADARAVTLVDGDFSTGGLRLRSFARPAKLFTANASLVRSVAGQPKRLTNACAMRWCGCCGLLRANERDVGQMTCAMSCPK
jgi:hypothetical protein